MKKVSMLLALYGLLVVSLLSGCGGESDQQKLSANARQATRVL